jgi:hypothetical protein
MMRIHLLVTPEMEPIPDDIKVVADFDTIEVMTATRRHTDDKDDFKDDFKGGKLTGRHLAIEGENEAVVAWLKPFDDVWLGVGQPFEQEFTVVHVAPPLPMAQPLPGVQK